MNDSTSNSTVNDTNVGNDNIIELVKCNLKQVVGRDGDAKPFDSMKIYQALKQASVAAGKFDDVAVKDISNKVLKVINHKFSETQTIYIERIQDIVEQVLISEDEFEVAKSYIIYRSRRSVQREDQKTMVDVESSINEYLRGDDWRINENANQGYSLGGMILNVSGKVTANYWLSHVYPKEVGQAHRDGDYHIHDLSMFSGYCAGWSLKTLLNEGYNGVPGHIECGAPKHLSAAVGQMVNFMGTLQNEWAGAQAFSSVDTYLAAYIRKDGLTYKETYQRIQELVFNLNVPSRWGTQTPFTNFTFDWVCPEDLKAEHPMIGGEEMAFTYGDLQEEMDMINKAYIEVMTRGDSKGRPFTFPIPTYNVTKDFIWDSENADLLFEMTAKYGTPYFQNFLNSSLNPSDVRSMCCRLQLDLRELKKRGGGLFGSAEQTGSVGVVTINCARLGYLYKGNEEAMLYRLDQLLDLAKNSLEIKRKVVTKHLQNGLFPFTKRYLGGFKSHFSTIGVNGINEMIRNFTDGKYDITSTYGNKFAEKILDHIRDKMVEFQEETGNMYNLEATPAEGTTYRFAKEDQKRFKDILQAGTEDSPYYTNSSQVPVGFTDDPFEELDLQDNLQTKYTGGTVLHMYMNERISSSDTCKKLIKKVCESYHLPYVTVTPTFSVCPKHGYIAGEHEFCPVCDQELLARKG